MRIAFVVLTFFGGRGVLLYGLGWRLLPHPEGRIHAQQVLTGTVTAGFPGAVPLPLATTHVRGPLLPLALLTLLVWTLKHPAPAPRRMTARPGVPAATPGGVPGAPASVRASGSPSPSPRRMRRVQQHRTAARHDVRSARHTG